MANDLRREHDNARQLGLARARNVAKLATPTGAGGVVGSKVAQKVFGKSRVAKVVGWVIGGVGCSCLIAIVFALLPILFIVVLGCGPLRLC